MKPEVAVSRLVEKHGTRNPFVICAREQIVVVRHPLIDMRGYYKPSNGIDVIVISDSLSDAAATFVCGHELGHWVFDKGENRIFADYCMYTIPDKLENRADRFSAHLNFGQPPLYQDNPITQWEMADMLNVSVCNVDGRLIDLGIYHC